MGSLVSKPNSVSEPTGMVGSGNQVPSVKPANGKVQRREPDLHSQSVAKRQNVKLKHNVTPGQRCFIPKDSGRDRHKTPHQCLLQQHKYQKTPNQVAFTTIQSPQDNFLPWPIMYQQECEAMGGNTAP